MARPLDKTLVIVESPAKAKTIEKFLGRRYRVVASMGHVRDLPKSKLGVDVDNDFEPHYITIRGKGDILKDLRKATAQASKVLLATDPDREGEAISWHLSQALKLGDSRAKRVEFHEITKDAVKRAIKQSRDIDHKRVDAQQARRVLDRLVGYKLSPLLWKKVRPGLSAGRVQSAALRLIADREDEIDSFEPVEYWTITGTFKTQDSDESFSARFSGSKDEKTDLPNRAAVDTVLERLKDARFVVRSVSKKERRRHAPPPFTTSTLQQEASHRLGYSGRKTMSIAQQLYEGIDVGPAGAVGLITYIRTDSTRVAEQARTDALEFVTQKYGENYLQKAAAAGDKSPGVQGAHEAIRPTSLERDPRSVKQYLRADQFKVYKMIWDRFIAAHMAAALYEVTAVEIDAAGLTFKASGSRLVFPGFIAFLTDLVDDESKGYGGPGLPPIEPENVLEPLSIEPKQHFTQPPPRFSEAMLVKMLEEKGIGRPSTYAPIVDTLLVRRYIVKSERRLQPTELGRLVTRILKEYFPDVVDVEFTANMEKQLDNIENGGTVWQQVLRDFYGDFVRTLETAEERIGGFEIEDEQTDIQCEKCGRMMVKKHGRYGPFLACPGYPECKNAKPIVERLDVQCPQCGRDLVVRKSKKGRTFYGCSGYPECTFVSWNRPLKEKCPDCGYMLVEKRSRGKTVKMCGNNCGYVAAAEENPDEDPGR